MNDEITPKDKFYRTLQSHGLEEIIQNTLFKKPDVNLGTSTEKLVQQKSVQRGTNLPPVVNTLKDDNQQAKKPDATKKNFNLSNISQLRNSGMIETCSQIHDIFNNCCRILGSKFLENQILNPKDDNETSGSPKLAGSNEKTRKRRTKRELNSVKIYKCNLPGCFKQYASKAALFLHVQRLHKPKSNFNKEINNELIQILDNHKDKLSNPNTKLRWGVDLNKVIKQRFCNLKKEGESFFRDKSTYCDTINNTIPKDTTTINNKRNLDSFTSNIENYSINMLSDNLEPDDDVFSLTSHNYNNFEVASYHSPKQASKPFDLEYPEIQFRSDCKIFGKRLKCDNLSSDCNNEYYSNESRDHLSIFKSSAERFNFGLSRSSASTKLFN